MEDDEPSDRLLIKRFQKGDLEAFDTFALRYQDRLTRLAATSLYTSVNVEDAVQEVFLRAYKGLSAFRFSAEPFTWMYRTLQNVCKEMNRKSSDSVQRLGVEAEAKDLRMEPNMELEVARNVVRVRQFVAALPQQQREVVVLRIFEGFSVAQTAKILGCKTGTVKAHLHKAIVNLRQSPELQDKEEELNYE